LAVELLKSVPWAKILSAEKGKMEIRIEPGRSSELNRFLVTSHVEVFSFSPHRTLEDYFLKVTEGTSEI
jgi:hypothetical protein